MTKAMRTTRSPLNPINRFIKSHQRELVARSSPFYKTTTTEVYALANERRFFQLKIVRKRVNFLGARLGRKDLNHPHTAVWGIFDAVSTVRGFGRLCGQEIRYERCHDTDGGVLALPPIKQWNSTTAEIVSVLNHLGG